MKKFIVMNGQKLVQNENFFQILKQYRAIATRYDKRASTFLGAIYMAASIIWLN